MSALYSKQSTSEVYNHFLRPHLVKQSTRPNEREEKRTYTFLVGKRREEWTGRPGQGRPGQATEGEKKKLRSAFLGFGVCVTGLHAYCHGGYGCRRRRRSFSLFYSFHPPHSSSRKSPHNQPSSHIFIFLFFSSSWFFFFFFSWWFLLFPRTNHQSLCVFLRSKMVRCHMGMGWLAPSGVGGGKLKSCVVLSWMSCHVMLCHTGFW